LIHLTFYNVELVWWERDCYRGKAGPSKERFEVSDLRRWTPRDA